MDHHYVAIMAGGVGSRFWPMSRESVPKQFLDILGTGASLLQQTVQRFQTFIPRENILIVTSALYRDKIAEQVPEVPRANILCEPMRKNTAPCIAYVSFSLQERDKDATLICAPADHYIRDTENFAHNCREAFDFIATHPRNFVIVGVPPTSPHTGYGYIQYLSEGSEGKLLRVKTFTEKPTLKLAQTFLADGHFLWNAGLFFAHNTFMLEMFKEHARELYDLFDEHKTLLNTQMQSRALEQIYPLCPANSFDYQVMEKMKDVYVIRAQFDWSDLGSWNSLDGLAPNIEGGVGVAKKIMAYGADHNIVHISDGKKLCVLQGLDNHIVVDTGDVLLICEREREQEIKQYVENIKSKKWINYL